jgi:NAD(P)H-nitrite reductase large subunit
METNLPGIYAAGDAAEITDCVTGERTPSGLWPTAARMGTVAGQNMAGARTRPELPPIAAMKNSVELFGVRAISVGMVNPPQDGDYREHTVQMPGAYRKAVTQGDRLVGAIFLGATGGAGIASAFIESGKPLPVPVDQLLRNLSAADFIRTEGRALDRYLNVSYAPGSKAPHSPVSAS